MLLPARPPAGSGGEGEGRGKSLGVARASRLPVPLSRVASGAVGGVMSEVRSRGAPWGRWGRTPNR